MPNCDLLAPQFSGRIAVFKILCLSWAISLGATRVHAEAGHEAASFLDIPVGAGPAALGGAYSALATDAYAPVWNPGGLAFLDSTQVAGQHLSYLESIHYEHLSVVHPLNPVSGIGVSAQYLGSGDMEGLDVKGDSLGEFSSHYAAYSIAYGRKITQQSSFGAAFKVIDAKISDVSATAYAGDFGALWIPVRRLRLAATVSNVGSQLKFLEEGGDLPLIARVGAAYRPAPQYEISAEGAYRRDGPTSAHVGFEWTPIRFLAFRAGYRTDATKETGDIAGFSTGMALRLFDQEFGYAWVPYGDLGSTHYFSLLLHFGRSPDGRRNLIKYQSIRPGAVAEREGSSESLNEIEQQQLMWMLSDHAEKRAAQVKDTSDTLEKTR